MEEISAEILKLCRGDKYPYKENKEKILTLCGKLEEFKIRDLHSTKAIIDLHKELSKLRNRKASYFEERIASAILTELPFRIRMRDEQIPEDTPEELSELDVSETRMTIKMSAELLKYGKEILASKDDKSKRYKKRLKEALRILTSLNDFYEIKGIKEMFMSKIDDKDEDVQFFALCGLESYYVQVNADKLTESEENKFDEIIKSTKTRETATTCCQILINAGKIDEFGAMMRIDNWKDRNWN